MPMAAAATVVRKVSRVPRAKRSPRPRSPIRLAWGMWQSVQRGSPMGWEAIKSIRLESSKPGVSASTTKTERPLLPSSGSVLANTV